MPKMSQTMPKDMSMPGKEEEGPSAGHEQPGGNMAVQSESGIESGQGASPIDYFDELLMNPESEPSDVAFAYCALSPQEKVGRMDDILRKATESDATAWSIVQGAYQAAVAATSGLVLALAAGDAAFQEGLKQLFDGGVEYFEATLARYAELDFVHFEEDGESRYNERPASVDGGGGLLTFIEVRVGEDLAAALGGGDGARVQLQLGGSMLPFLTDYSQGDVFSSMSMEALLNLQVRVVNSDVPYEEARAWEAPVTTVRKLFNGSIIGVPSFDEV